MTNRLTCLPFLAAALLPLTACDMSLVADSEGNFEGTIEIGTLAVTSAASDEASKGLPPIGSLHLLGYSVSSDFHGDGAISLGMLALDINGEAILDADIYLEADVTCDVSFPMGGSIQIGTAHQPNQGQPFQMAIDLDGSGSMGGSDPQDRRIPASQGLIDEINESFPGSTFSAWEFNDDVNLLIDFTTDTNAVKSAVTGVGSDGSTRLHDSVQQILQGFAANPNPATQPAILLLSDGMDTASDADRGAVISQAQALGVPIYAVGLGGALDIPGLNFVDDLQVYAHDTGGMFTYIDHAGALEQAFENMALGIANGYQEITLVLAGGFYLPFSTCSVTLEARAGESQGYASFEFVVPFG
ncbi:MAG: VWA domain-containing protein [Deltaproteobacteria bacterium]|nr:VWA domain-containing protein [Deltaproteobacteria bacterium]